MKLNITKIAGFLLLALIAVTYPADIYCQNHTIRRRERPVRQTQQTNTNSQANSLEKKYQKDLDAGEQLLDAEKYAEAKTHFESMLSKYPKHKTDINRYIRMCEMGIAEQEEQQRLREEEQARLEEQRRQEQARLEEEQRQEKQRRQQELYNATHGEINGHEWVDLGLPSGLKWATCNIGASCPEEYGDYYAWGEIKTKSKYKEGNCKTWEKNMGDISGNSSYDAAIANWGDSWRMPTQAEFNELLSNCTWILTTQDGQYGYKMKSKINGNSIFLPAAGYRDDSSFDTAGSWGYYWCSTPFENDIQKAYYVGFCDKYFTEHWHYRYFGYSVRPVSE